MENANMLFGTFEIFGPTKQTIICVCVYAILPQMKDHSNLLECNFELYAVAVYTMIFTGSNLSVYCWIEWFSILSITFSRIVYAASRLCVHSITIVARAANANNR